MSAVPRQSPLVEQKAVHMSIVELQDALSASREEEQVESVDRPRRASAAANKRFMRLMMERLDGAGSTEQQAQLQRHLSQQRRLSRQETLGSQLKVAATSLLFAKDLERRSSLLELHASGARITVLMLLVAMFGLVVQISASELCWITRLVRTFEDNNEDCQIGDQLKICSLSSLVILIALLCRCVCLCISFSLSVYSLMRTFVAI
jgi:hypothetical protein